MISNTFSNVFLFSGELPNFQTKNWLNSVIAGQRWVEEKQYGDSIYYKVRPEAKRAIEEFYRGRLYICEDGYPNTRTALMSRIEEACMMSWLINELLPAPLMPVMILSVPKKIFIR